MTGLKEVDDLFRNLFMFVDRTVKQEAVNYPYRLTCSIEKSLFKIEAADGDLRFNTFIHPHEIQYAFDPEDIVRFKLESVKKSFDAWNRRYE